MRGALVGSNSNNGTTAGAGAWNSNNTASNSNTNIGSQAGFWIWLQRPCLLAKNNKGPDDGTGRIIEGSGGSRKYEKGW